MKKMIIGALATGGILCAAACAMLEPQSLADSRGGLNPIENYKEKRFQDAVRGLDFRTGRVRVDAAGAAQVLSAGPVPSFDEQLAEAQRLLEGNAYVESIGAFRTAVLLRPSSREALVGLAKSLRTEGEVAKGIAALRTALDAGARDAETRFLLGEFLWQNDQWREAQQVLLQVTTLTPSSEEEARFIGEAWRMLASAYWYANDPKAALNAAQRAAEYGVETPPQLLEMIRERLQKGEKK
jgi:tetratricopeptide (TPR) repeat protein